MPSTANYQALEPSPDHLSEGHALGNAPSLTHNTIKRKPCPGSAYVPAADNSTSLVLSPQSSPASLLATQGAAPHDLPSTSNANAQPAQADLTEKQRPLSKDHALKEAGLWSRLVADWWVLELVAAFVSLTAIASVFGVLMAYDQKPVPPLVKGITVRAALHFSITYDSTRST